jgi:hypothetical protein
LIFIIGPSHGKDYVAAGRRFIMEGRSPERPRLTRSAGKLKSKQPPVMTPRKEERIDYRIALLSDLHLTGVNRDFECCLALVEDAAAHGANHLVISGDLVESGEMKILKAFVSALKDLGWAGSRFLTIVPGNHDIFPATNRKIPTFRRPTSVFNDFIAITRGSRIGKGFRHCPKGIGFPKSSHAVNQQPTL